MCKGGGRRETERGFRVSYAKKGRAIEEAVLALPPNPTCRSMKASVVEEDRCGNIRALPGKETRAILRSGVVDCSSECLSSSCSIL